MEAAIEFLNKGKYLRSPLGSHNMFAYLVSPVYQNQNHPQGVVTMSQHLNYGLSPEILEVELKYLNT